MCNHLLIPRPTLVLVAGAPASGKTTLARKLSAALPAPLLDKDSIKSGLCVTSGQIAVRGDPVGAAAFEVLWECTEALLRAGCTTVVEAAFHRDHMRPALKRLGPLAEVRLICCEAPVRIATRRYRARAAESGREAHADDAVLAEMEGGAFPWSSYDVTGIGPRCLVVKTAEGYSPGLSAVIEFVRQA